MCIQNNTCVQVNTCNHSATCRVLTPQEMETANVLVGSGARPVARV